MKFKNLMIILLAISFVSMPVFADSLLSYSIILKHDNGNFAANDLAVVQATPNNPSQIGEYKARIVSFSNRVLYETNFDVNPVIAYSLPLDNATRESPAARKTIDLLLPYYSNGKTLQILKGENILLEIDLSQFTLCNENSLCESSETPAICPSDCSCGNGICDSNENYGTCSNDCKLTLKQETSSNNWIYLAAIIPIITVLAFLIIGKSKKK